GGAGPAGAARAGSARRVGGAGGRIQVRGAAGAPGPGQQVARGGGPGRPLRVMPAERVAERRAWAPACARRKYVWPQVVPVARRAVGTDRTRLGTGGVEAVTE